MVTLKEACKIISKTCPDQYIHCVNEFPKVFEFILVPNGLTIDDVGGSIGMADVPLVDKENGKVRYSNFMDPTVQGDYKQYSGDDIKS